MAIAEWPTGSGPADYARIRRHEAGRDGGGQAAKRKNGCQRLSIRPETLLVQRSRARWWGVCVCQD